MSVADILGQLMRDAGAQRVLCIRAEWHIADSWRRPTKVWIEREVCAGLPSIASEWQDREANGRWEALLLDVMRHTHVQLVTARMPNSRLKSAYVADGVAYAELVTLGHWQHEVQRYLAVHWSDVPATMVSLRAGEVSRALAVELAGLP